MDWLSSENWIALGGRTHKKLSQIMQVICTAQKTKLRFNGSHINFFSLQSVVTKLTILQVASCTDISVPTVSA